MNQKIKGTTPIWQRLAAMFLSLMILFQMTPAGVLDALPTGDVLETPQDVDALVMNLETDTQAEDFAFGDPITFSTTVKGDGINNGGIVRIVCLLMCRY